MKPRVSCLDELEFGVVSSIGLSRSGDTFPGRALFGDIGQEEGHSTYDSSVLVLISAGR